MNTIQAVQDNLNPQGNRTATPQEPDPTAPGTSQVVAAVRDGEVIRLRPDRETGGFMMADGSSDRFTHEEGVAMMRDAVSMASSMGMREPSQLLNQDRDPYNNMDNEGVANQPASPGRFGERPEDGMADNFERAPEVATLSYRDHVEGDEYQLNSEIGRNISPGETHPAVAHLQEWMAESGHDPGIIDGRWGPQTAEAFQRAWEETTGNPPPGVDANNPPVVTNIPYLLNYVPRDQR
ncbi:MAG: peptidoglycan-binding protein [Wenzhouxiangella sp.]|nr:peptidoglycan-binding protein [Wenzhouxiangella sp.]